MDMVAFCNFSHRAVPCQNIGHPSFQQQIRYLPGISQPFGYRMDSRYRLHVFDTSAFMELPEIFSHQPLGKTASKIPEKRHLCNRILRHVVFSCDSS